MKQYGHVIPVQCSIEHSNIDQTISETIAKIPSIQRRFSIVVETYLLILVVRSLDAFVAARILGIGDGSRKQEEQDRQCEKER